MTTTTKQLILNGVKLVNLTPHDLILLDDNLEPALTIPSQGEVRLEEKKEVVGSVNGIPLIKKSFGGTELPPEKENTLYIVSLPVAQYAKSLGRKDFLVPGDIVRSEDRSTIKGMRGLAVL